MVKQDPSRRQAAIDASLEDERKLRVTYRSEKAGGELVTRTLKPVELKGRCLWTKDTVHDNIHSLRSDRIVSARVLKEGYRAEPGFPTIEPR
jgi:hypothetical protein